MRLRNLVMAFMILGVILGLNTVSAAIDIKADPSNIDVPKGGYATTTLEVTVDSEGTYTVGFDIGTSSQSALDANLTGPNGDHTGFDDSGELSLTANSDGNYYYTLNISATSDASTDETYGICIYNNANYLSGEECCCEIATDVILVNPVPELVTGVLIGIGLVTLGVIRKRR